MCVSLSLTHMHTSPTVYPSTGIHISGQSTRVSPHTLRDKRVQVHKDRQYCMQAGGPCCTLLNCHDTCCHLPGISSPAPPSSSSPTHQTSISVSSLSVKQMCARNKTGTDAHNLLKISKCTEDAETMRHACVHMFSVISQPAVAKTVDSLFEHLYLV